MNEGANIEAEIAALSQQIDAKRAELARERGGTIESREVLHTIVGEQLGHTSPPLAQTPAPSPTTISPSHSYLDGLDPDEITAVNTLIDMVMTKGLSQAVAKAKESSPLILDAFHDALTDKLQAELKSRDLI